MGLREYAKIPEVAMALTGWKLAEVFTDISSASVAWIVKPNPTKPVKKTRYRSQVLFMSEGRIVIFGKTSFRRIPDSKHIKTKIGGKIGMSPVLCVGVCCVVLCCVG